MVSLVDVDIDVEAAQLRDVIPQIQVSEAQVCHRLHGFYRAFVPCDGKSVRLPSCALYVHARIAYFCQMCVQRDEVIDFLKARDVRCALLNVFHGTFESSFAIKHVVGNIRIEFAAMFAYERVC